jgi:hypothetical protein
VGAGAGEHPARSRAANNTRAAMMICLDFINTILLSEDLLSSWKSLVLATNVRLLLSRDGSWFFIPWLTSRDVE